MRDGAHASCDVTWVTSQGPQRRFMFEATVEIVMVQCGLFLTSGLAIQMLSFFLFFFLLFSMLSRRNRTPRPRPTWHVSAPAAGRTTHSVCVLKRGKSARLTSTPGDPLSPLSPFFPAGPWVNTQT